MAINSFDEITLKNVSSILAEIFTNKEITIFLSNLNIPQSSIGTNKEDRLFNAFREKQISDKCGNNILAAIQSFLTPKRFDNEETFELLRSRINGKLIYDGIQIDKSGTATIVTKAKTISEAKERSNKIKNKIQGIKIHHDVIKYCESEWLVENYFHAILEITKGVAEKIRNKSGCISDGAELIDEALGLGKDKKPMLAFNTLGTPSEESEHKGFSNFCKGFFSMYRNPKAHTPKILEDTQLESMLEVLIVASIIQNKLDKTHKTGYK